MIFTCGSETFHLEDKLTKKLDYMCGRVTKDNPKLDAVIANSGMEGEGKTNASIIESAYIKSKTSRSINLFFSTQSCLRFAQTTKEQIIILDEPSLDLLSADHATKKGKDFLRLMSTIRKRRHFFIINFAKFWKFPEFLVVDRSLGMLHLDSKDGKNIGRFVYIRKKMLEVLWNGYKKEGLRKFNKLKAFGGWLPYRMEIIWDCLDIRVENILHSTYEDYEKEKDKAIESIGQEDIKKDKNLMKLLELRKKVSQVRGINRESLANMLGINSSRLREWARIDLDAPLSLENDDFEVTTAANISSTMGYGVEKHDDSMNWDELDEEKDKSNSKPISNKPIGL